MRTCLSRSARRRVSRVPFGTHHVSSPVLPMLNVWRQLGHTMRKQEQSHPYSLHVISPQSRQ